MSNNITIAKYAFRLIVFSTVIAAIALLMQWIFPLYASPALPFIVIFFFFITLFTLFVVLRDEQKKETRQFISGYMLSRIVKLMSCIIFLVLYIILNRVDRWNFAGAFLLIYFLFAAYEIVALKTENSNIKKKNS